eukprot:TRINITY_DN1145_c1_g1_i1.p2 TRINITY_DN1145_c1_g1~~TRINITY_DN1145_c1_g1_i1.p2  ORF type:complete len:101 (+),score=19.43 TRINITY_DN1145_c1_g1_i1:640-942(+)
MADIKHHNYPIPIDDIVNLRIKSLNKELKKINVPKERKDEIKNLRRTERAKMYDAAKRDGTNREIQRLEVQKKFLLHELQELQEECHALNEYAEYLIKIL